MKQRTLRHANALNNRIVSLRKHLEEVQGTRVRLRKARESYSEDTTDQLGLLNNGGSNAVTLNPKFFVMAPDKLMDLYEREVQAAIDRKQEELDHLTDENSREDEAEDDTND